MTTYHRLYEASIIDASGNGYKQRASASHISDALNMVFASIPSNHEIIAIKEITAK